MGEAYVWHLRNPDGGATGLEVANGVSAPTDRMLAHALPQRVSVDVRIRGGERIAVGRNLQNPESTPMSLLTLAEGKVERVNLWPTDEHVGLPVILPGGEVGILQSWWNAEDGSAWRWVVEFSNRRRG